MHQYQMHYEKVYCSSKNSQSVMAIDTEFQLVST